MTKQLYEQSCLQSICLSHLFHNVPLIVKFSGVVTNDRSDVPAKGWLDCNTSWVTVDNQNEVHGFIVDILENVDQVITWPKYVEQEKSNISYKICTHFLLCFGLMWFYHIFLWIFCNIHLCSPGLFHWHIYGTFGVCYFVATVGFQWRAMMIYRDTSGATVVVKMSQEKWIQIYGTT